MYLARSIMFHDLSGVDTKAKLISPNLQLSAGWILPIVDRLVNFLKHSNGRSRTHTWETRQKSRSYNYLCVCRNACARRQSPVRMQVGRPITRGAPPTRAQCERNRRDRCNAIKAPLCVHRHADCAQRNLGAACNYCEIRGARVHAGGRERSGLFICCTSRFPLRRRRHYQLFWNSATSPFPGALLIRAPELINIFAH